MKRILAFFTALILLFGAVSCAAAPVRTSGEPSGEPSGTPRITPSPGETDTPQSPSESGQTTNEEPDVEPTEDDVKLFQNSYDILYDRITDRGYAITSLTGTYVGMFTRDSSIQAMAHIAYGDPDAARAILRYLFSCHAALGLKYGTHIVDEMKEEAYRNDYLRAGQTGGEKTGALLSQRDCETAIYRINAPGNGAAQPFIPQNDAVRSVEVNLGKSGNRDAVNVSIRTDYADSSTAVGETTYVFGGSPSGWQRVFFETPVPVTPGQTYYLVLQATPSSGNVVWYGTTSNKSGYNTFNYDVAAFGGWIEKPYGLGFEVLSYPAGTTAQSFAARGGEVCGAELDVYAGKAGGSVRAEIRQTPDGALLGSASAPVGAGEQTISLDFGNVPVTPGEKYFLVVSFEDAAQDARLLTDPLFAADSFAFSGAWAKIGYELQARMIFDVDRAPLLTLENGSAGVQEIPTDGELITAVRVLLSKEAGAAGRLRATLCKGYGDGAQIIDESTVDISDLSETPGWVKFSFGLPLSKTKKDGSYFLRLETENASGRVFWSGSGAADGGETFLETEAGRVNAPGEASFEALRSEVRQISNYVQTDTTFMLLHAWAMFEKNNAGAPEDLLFIEQSYPLVKTFANYFFGSSKAFDKKLGLLYNASLEHSRKGRYWQSYDLITNVFASQALHELSAFASKTGDAASAEKWASYAAAIEAGINKNLVTEYDGKKIYGEFYDAEDGMKFYPGVSWVNFAPVAAEWYGTDLEIMKNTYEVYKKHAGIKMLGFDGLATDATLGTNEIRRELIGKGVAWELMFCAATGDSERVEQILRLEEATAKKYRLSVYPESWTSQDTVSDPGNQEHCAWQVYAFCRVFPELTKRGAPD